MMMSYDITDSCNASMPNIGLYGAKYELQAVVRNTQGTSPSSKREVR